MSGASKPQDSPNPEIAVLETRIRELENLLPTALEREQMRKVCKYAEMVEKALSKDGL